MAFASAAHSRSLGVSSFFSLSTLQEWSICASQATRGGKKMAWCTHLGTSGSDCTRWHGGAGVERHVWESRFALSSNSVVSLCIGFGEAFGERDHLLERSMAKTNKSAGRSKYGHNSHWEKLSSLYVLLSLLEYVCVCVCVCVRDTQNSREVEGE